LETLQKIKVLYLDDEPNNLICFMATFRFDFTIFIAPDIPKAYEYLIANPDISVIVADQRMPIKTGVEFFEEIRLLFPNPVRMLITAYADIEAVIDAVNKGCIFRYIRKPWEDEDIKFAIEEAHKFFLSNSLLTAKNIELQAAYDELGKFAYSVTHDLRGPLLSVLGALEVSKDMNTVEELKDILGMMEVAIKKLDEFIKNIHEYYTLKKGIVVLEDIDFNAMLNDMSGLFKIAGKMEHIQFNCQVNQTQPFQSDVVSLKIILNNLLSNAFKYQRKNETDKYVDISIDVTNNVATIIVKDNGIGIHDKHINNIFSMFYRATTEQSGSGFGLYNVKDALNKLKGEVEVNSSLNIGTTFKVTIPGKSNDTN